LSIYARPFRKEDLTAFVPVQPMRTTKIDEYSQIIENAGFAVTGVKDGKVVGCGGVVALEGYQGQGELWLRLSKVCQESPFDTLRWLKSGLKIIEETYPFDQLWAAVDCGFEKSVKLVKYLGFKKVTDKKHDGKDWTLYKKVL
jgi:hypothetical protein